MSSRPRPEQVLPRVLRLASVLFLVQALWAVAADRPTRSLPAGGGLPALSRSVGGVQGWPETRVAHGASVGRSSRSLGSGGGDALRSPLGLPLLVGSEESPLPSKDPDSPDDLQPYVPVHHVKRPGSQGRHVPFRGVCCNTGFSHPIFLITRTFRI